MKKKRLFNVSIVGALALAGQFVCFPVFAENSVNVQIVEVVNNGAGEYKAWEDIVGAMPGMNYSAIPRVKNNGEVPVEVRMCLSESATSVTGETISLPVNTFGIKISEGWTLDTEAAANPSDPATGNCYNYNAELAVGEMTEPLFYEIALNSELGNEYANSTFSLHLRAEAKGDALPEPVSPDSPDTGVNSAREAFLINSGLMLLSAGILALVIVGLRKIIRK